MTPRDLARIGLLTLRGGVWEGRQVVPAEWIARSTSPVVDEEKRQYGYQDWYNMAITVETPAIPALEPAALERFLRQWRPAN